MKHYTGIMAVLLAVTSAALAKQPDEVRISCGRQLSVAYDAEWFARALAPVPTLRAIILELMEDSTLPAPLKRIFHTALEHGYIDFILLTDELRRSLDLDATTHAFYVARNMTYGMFHPPGAPPSHNEKFGAKMSNVGTAAFSVAVSDRPLTEEVNDLINLLHELAHVRFQLFLQKHSLSVLKRWPKSLAYFDEMTERPYFNRFLIDLIEERFTHEKEFEMLVAAGGRYMPSRYFRYPESLQTLPKAEATAFIGYHVLKRYELETPEMYALASAPIGEILLGTSARLRAMPLVLEEIGKEGPTDPAQFDIIFTLRAMRLRHVGKLEAPYGYDDADRALALLGFEKSAKVKKERFAELEAYVAKHRELGNEWKQWMARPGVKTLVSSLVSGAGHKGVGE